MNNGILRVARIYDAADNLTGISSASGGVTYGYGQAYNKLDKRVSVTTPGGGAWRYTYDSMGQVTSAAKFGADGRPIAGLTHKYAYDEIGNLKAEERGGDLS